MLLLANGQRASTLFFEATNLLASLLAKITTRSSKRAVFVAVAISLAFTLFYLFDAQYTLFGPTRYSQPLLRQQLPTEESNAKLEIGNSRELSESAVIARLLERCHRGTDVVVTRDLQHAIGGTVDEDIVRNSCFPIEITTPQSGRSMGHCSDFVQYIYHAGARLSPSFSKDKENKYHNQFWREHMKRCPNSIHLWGEYPERIFFEAKGIRNLWMPNVEQVPIVEADLFPLTDGFIAKTRHAQHVITEYLAKFNISVPVRYMSHSSPDGLIGVEHIKRDFNKFFHGFGHSGLKGTRELAACWAKHPEWPTLTFVGNFVDELLQYFPDNVAPANVILHDRLGLDEMRIAQREHAVHICPSVREGYGHYINDARAMGALILTTDFGPMNEFVDHDTGILIPHTGYNDEVDIKLFAHVDIHTQVHMTPEFICDTVERAIKMPLEERERRGNMARAAYEDDRRIMIRNLHGLKRKSLEWYLQTKVNSSVEEEKAFVEIGRNYRTLAKNSAERAGFAVDF
ncbi:hypothetical protein BJ742DRAFT_815897 [Cladochytrium replicatum]|nr:hypothetical protein BJ742DRAFT_815897 [Cladochytrium replicatum]